MTRIRKTVLLSLAVLVLHGCARNMATVTVINQSPDPIAAAVIRGCGHSIEAGPIAVGERRVVSLPITCTGTYAVAVEFTSHRRMDRVAYLAKRM